MPDIKHISESSSNVLFSSVFREMLQNSDDSGSRTVEVHFETAAYRGQRDRRGEILDVPTLSDLKSAFVLVFGPSHGHLLC